jgi:hypothetical protein
VTREEQFERALDQQARQHRIAARQAHIRFLMSSGVPLDRITALNTVFDDLNGQRYRREAA